MKRTFFSTLTAVSACSIALLISATSFAEGAAVRYSYAKTDFNGQPIYALIPNVDPRFDSRTNKLNVQKAFSALKADKSNTYLNTTASVSGSDAAPKVSIQIDPNAAAKGYSLIIMAEAVYTLSELGVREVTFPGLASRPMARGDIPFVAFSVNVPLWRALTPGSKRDAINSPNIHIIMPDGTVVPSEEIAKQWKSKDKKLNDQLYKYLDAPDTYTVKEVAKLLKGWNLPYGDKVIQLLKNPSVSVQNAGLELLADERDEKNILEAVKSYLGTQKKRKNAAQAAAAAVWLGQSKDKAYSIEQPLFFIDNGTPEQAAQAATQLGDYSDKESIKKLQESVDSKTEAVAVAAVNSLAKHNDNAFLKRALGFNKVSDPIKLIIAKNLSKAKDEDDQLAGLSYLVDKGSVKERVDAVQGIGAIRSNSARALLDRLFTSNDDFVSRAAAEQLIKRAEQGSLNAVAAAMKKGGPHAEVAQEIGDAIMEKLGFQEVEKKTRDKNDEIQRLAYRAISKKSKIRSVLDILERALTHKNASIRGAATVSLLEFYSKYPDKVEEGIKKSVADSDATVRRDAAIAIGELPEGKLTDQLSLLIKDKDPKVVAATIHSLAKRSEALEWNTIKEKTKSSDDDERAAAYLALSKLVSPSDAKGVREVISSLSGAVGDKSKKVKVAAIKGLGAFKDDRAVASIAVNASSDDVLIRIVTLEAVANSKHASAKPILVSGLDDPDAAVRAAAVKGLAVLNDKTTKADLAKRLQKETDPDIRTLIEQTQKSL